MSAIITGPVKLVEFSIMSLMYVILIWEIVQFVQKIDQYGIKQYLLVQNASQSIHSSILLSEPAENALKINYGNNTQKFVWTKL